MAAIFTRAVEVLRKDRQAPVSRRSNTEPESGTTLSTVSATDSNRKAGVPDLGFTHLPRFDMPW